MGRQMLTYAIASMIINIIHNIIVIVIMMMIIVVVVSLSFIDIVLGDWPAKWPCQATRSTYQLVALDANKDETGLGVCSKHAWIARAARADEHVFEFEFDR